MALLICLANVRVNATTSTPPAPELERIMPCPFGEFYFQQHTCLAEGPQRRDCGLMAQCFFCPTPSESRAVAGTVLTLTLLTMGRRGPVSLCCKLEDASVMTLGVQHSVMS